jgi:hypothetical protein
LTVHVLTKIFIVLVSLLAVFLVPLVVVYAHNESSFKKLHQQAEAQILVAREEAGAATAALAAAELRLNRRIDELRAENSTLSNDRNQAIVENQRLESRVATAESMKAQIQAELARLSSGVQTGTTLASTLVEELRTVRRDAMVSERQRVEMEEQLRDVLGQLEVAVAARRALQEEVQRLSDQNQQTMTRLSSYIARFGTLSDDPVALGGAGGIIPDRNITTTVLAVRRGGGQVLAEINAGSRDGVKEGWRMIIGRGSEFIANLQIISVDINRSTGVVTLESPQRGLVNVGDVVQSLAGMD